ncbi:hypothetical protein F4808DRAFT_415940 [Astrocystis sublimbata]|nr:hypothetical protein F4808DRAFT_415940 [Astrocystis sublimbata]
MNEEPSEDLLGAKIGQLLHTNALNRLDISANARHLRNRRQLQQLDISNTSGNTLVIVKFPPGTFIDCDGYMWKTKEFFMDSRKLLATGSSLFKALLSPEVQAQTRRHLGYDEKTYPQAEFVLDLTPPNEGLVAGGLISQLSLSRGVRDWWMSYYISHVPNFIVSGHDDVCPRHFDLVLFRSNSEHHLDKPSGVADLEFSEPRNTDDYCPIRHRAAVLRLLMCIEGGDLVLDSAPRTATMIIIAKYFDCIDLVKDSVFTWFMSEPNQEFILVNAEDALWMGWKLRLRAVTRMAFRVLVVERAFENYTNKVATHNRTRDSSPLGRIRGSVADEQETYIEHAAQKLLQRSTNSYAQLLSNQSHKLLGIKEWPSSHPTLCHKLHTYIQRLVQDATITTNVAMAISIEPILEDYDVSRARYVPKVQPQSTKEIYMGLSPHQYVLTRAFWRRLDQLACDSARLFREIEYAATTLPQPTPYPWMETSNTGAQMAVSLFDRAAFHRDFVLCVRKLGDQWSGYDDLEIRVPKTSFLILGLSDDETNYLPLWAGGLDDGTGTIFQPEIPDAQRGFAIGPGPAYRTGETIPEAYTSTVDGDGTSLIMTDDTDASISLTEGRSINPAHSQVSQASRVIGNDIELVASATTGLNLQEAEEDTTMHEPTVIAQNALDDFDWTVGASGDLDEQLDFGFNSDSDAETLDEGANTPIAAEGKSQVPQLSRTTVDSELSELSDNVDDTDVTNVAATTNYTTYPLRDRAGVSGSASSVATAGSDTDPLERREEFVFLPVARQQTFLAENPTK